MALIDGAWFCCWDSFQSELFTLIFTSNSSSAYEEDDHIAQVFLSKVEQVVIFGAGKVESCLNRLQLLPYFLLLSRRCGLVFIGSAVYCLLIFGQENLGNVIISN